MEVKEFSCTFVFHLTIVMCLLNYGAMEVGSKYCNHGQKLKERWGKSFLYHFENILISHADTFHKSVLSAPWNKVLRVSICQIGYTKELAYL